MSDDGLSGWAPRACRRAGVPTLDRYLRRSDRAILERSRVGLQFRVHLDRCPQDRQQAIETLVTGEP